MSKIPFIYIEAKDSLSWVDGKFYAEWITHQFFGMPQKKTTNKLHNCDEKTQISTDLEDCMLKLWSEMQRWHGWFTG